MTFSQKSQNNDEELILEWPEKLTMVHTCVTSSCQPSCSSSTWCFAYFAMVPFTLSIMDHPRAEIVVAALVACSPILPIEEALVPLGLDPSIAELVAEVLC
jgi:hypothetical protein